MEEFGEERVESLIENSEKISFRKDIDLMLRAQKVFIDGMPLQDDITIIGINRE